MASQNNSMPTEMWAGIAAAIGAAGVVARKLLNRKPKAEYITRTEFHQELNALRDRIGGSYVAVAEKLDVNHKEALGAIERLARATEQRLDQLEATVARLDERTRRE